MGPVEHYNHLRDIWFRAFTESRDYLRGLDGNTSRAIGKIVDDIIKDGPQKHRWPDTGVAWFIRHDPDLWHEVADSRKANSELPQRCMDCTSSTVFCKNCDPAESQDGQPPTSNVALTPDEIHPHFCVQHGGSADGERVNGIYGFACPKCQPPSDKYEAELERAAAILQSELLVGQVKAIGLLEVAAGVQQLADANELLRLKLEEYRVCGCDGVTLEGMLDADSDHSVSAGNIVYDLRPGATALLVPFVHTPSDEWDEAGPCRWYAPVEIDFDGEEYPGEEVYGVGNESEGYISPVKPGDIISTTLGPRRVVGVRAVKVARIDDPTAMILGYKHEGSKYAAQALRRWWKNEHPGCCWAWVAEVADD